MNGCDDVRARLAAFDEGELPPDERDVVLVHLAGCAACEAELERERTLTRRLVACAAAPRPRAGRLRRGLVALAAAAALLLALLPWMASGPEAYGRATLAALPVARDGTLPPLEEFGRVALEGAAPRSFALLASNHFVVAPGERLRVELAGVATLEARGPVRFELERGEARWKLVLLAGSVAAELAPDSSLFVVSALGETTLEGGRYALELEAALFVPEPDDGTTPAELLQRAHAAFFTPAHASILKGLPRAAELDRFAAAEGLYQRVLDDPRSSAEQRDDALFYRVAAIARQERWEDALAAGRELIAQRPDHPSIAYVTFFQGHYLQQLGRLDEARDAYGRVLALDPQGEMAKHAQAALAALDGAGAGARAGAKVAPARGPASGAASSCVVPARGERGGVAVVALGLDARRPDDRALLAVAKEAAQFHRAKLAEVALDGERFEERLRTLLARERPRAALLFVAPRDLDVALHRRVLLLATRLDDDPFADCAFGWMTARDGAALAQLWKRTQALRRDGPSGRLWLSSFVMGQGPSMVWPEWHGELQRAAGYESRGIGYATIEHDPKVLDFAAQHWRDLEAAGVLAFTGNGDPQGIWLFDDHRNIDAARHWPFDPRKVGHDPDGSMPRLLAADYAKLRLARPVVWSGTCHSAAVGRVFVEGDIVSTFGAVERVTPFELPAGTSLALALLDAGAAALLAPIGANHGYAVDLEEEFALTSGAPLGEVVKSTWDDVVGAAGGELRLVLPVAGAAFDRSEPIMQGGGANRLLIGDPTLAPFEPVAPQRESVEVVERGAGRFDVVVRWDAGWHSRAWDLYGEDRTRDGRIAARVDLEPLLRDARARRLSATAAVAEAGARGDDAKLPFVLTRVLAEEFHGRRWLHLQANAPRKAMEGKALVATFEVRIEEP